MAKGDPKTQDVLAAAAAADGVMLVRASLPAINERGHFGLPPAAAAAISALTAIFEELAGDAAVQASARIRRLQGDFVHPASGIFLEVDEVQHFTDLRMTALGLYPSDARLGFGPAEYAELRGRWGARADRYRREKPAKPFPGERGRARQRAYYDSLRDLALPALGHPPVVRIAAPDGDGAAAYARNRDRLHEVFGL